MFSVHAYLNWWMEKKPLYLYLELNEVKLSQPTGAGVAIQRQVLAYRDLQAVFIPIFNFFFFSET